MKRDKFLSLLGLSFIGSFFFSAKKETLKQLVTDCNDPITPPVPEGPFYKNEKLNRMNILESKKGVPIEYVFKVEDKNCKPIQGAIVDIWQCDNNGHYSDFKQENTLSETWLRGYQVTDEKGECRFHSIFPGWYNGRLTHVHGKVHMNGQNVLTTNFFFTPEVEKDVYSNTSFYTKGLNPVTRAEDIELRVDKDGVRHDTLVMKVAKNDKGHLTAFYTIAIA